MYYYRLINIIYIYYVYIIYIITYTLYHTVSYRFIQVSRSACPFGGQTIKFRISHVEASLSKR